MSTPSVHFKVAPTSSDEALYTASQTILITNHTSIASTPPPNDTLEAREIVRPIIDLEMLANVIELAKVPIVEQKGSLNLLTNFADRLTPKAVATLAQSITRAAVKKLDTAVDRDTRHKDFVTSLRQQKDLSQSRIDNALLEAKTNWEQHMATALTDQQANHLVNIKAVRASSRATVEELEHCIHTYEERHTVKCPEEFKENWGCIPHFPIILNRFTIQACYIKYIDQGHIIGTRRGPNDTIFIQDLYATSCIDADHVPDPLPAWFFHHIPGNSDTYPLVIKEALTANDWGVHADMQRYHCTYAHILSI